MRSTAQPTVKPTVKPPVKPAVKPNAFGLDRGTRRPQGMR